MVLLEEWHGPFKWACACCERVRERAEKTDMCMCLLVWFSVHEKDIAVSSAEYTKLIVTVPSERQVKK